MTGVRGGARVAALAGALLVAGAAPARASGPTSEPAVPAARPAASADLSPEALRLLEREAAEAARAEDWVDVLAHLNEIHRRAPARYADGRFEFLAAKALAGLGRIDEALVRFERFSSPGDLFDVPSRLAAARLRFGKGNGTEALDLLLPLLQRKEGAISRRALRTALDALETRFDAAALARLVAARPQTPPRERRRLQALRAEALEREGATGEAAALRLSLLAEGRRDDAAAALLARELAGRTPSDLPGATLRLLVDTARSQRDLELAERLAAEREMRALAGADAAETAVARFDLARLRGSRGRFAEAASGFSTLLASLPKQHRPPARKGDDSFGTAAFAGRVRFNLGAMKEKLGDLDGAVEEFRRVEAGGAGPVGLSVLQRARLEIRRGNLGRAEELLLRPSIALEPGRVEALLLLVERRAQSGDGAGAARALAPVTVLAKSRRLPEPWLSELPFWTGLVARTRGDTATALSQWAALLAADPGSFAAERALARIAELPVAVRERFVASARADGRRLLRSGKAAEAKDRLLPAAALGDAEAKEALREAYRALPRYADVLLAPELPDESLPDLCGDAAACRLLQLGLAEDAEPIVREARRLDTLLGSLVAARLAEDAGAGPAALEAAEAVSRKVPRDFLLELAPRTIRRGLAPRPFDRLVAQAAAELGVPRDLLYAVMRQESRFDREAASPAAARGLMQLTLPAAGEAARELNEAPPAYSDLYDPARSIRLGAQTLRTLLDRFDGDATRATSGYNAGAGQTVLWSGGSDRPAEALLAAISYAETRTYVRRVLANRRAYRLALPEAEAIGGRR
ncbi:MAG: lytic transglycosylase domain-containing protein [Thermoanaerobaculia bacterium]|nr:lytic transglycosylase domain-containing protein [Thermoanaerobaculia bacterium]